MSTSLDGHLTTFQQHRPLLFSIAYRMLGSVTDAEDILQTVFLRLARGPQPSVLENPEGYFARAAINASLDLLRSRKRSKTVAVDDIDDQQPVPAFEHDRSSDPDPSQSRP